MIESEEKRRIITERLERWVKHTKVDWLLRPGDIPGLVSSIIEEFYHISLCCGHYVQDMEEGVNLSFVENFTDEDGFQKGIISGVYCKDCAEIYKKELGAWETK